MDVCMHICVYESLCVYVCIYVCMCVCVSTCSLTLSAAAADLPEHGSLTQPVESLLADQLQQLGLQALFQLTEETKSRQKK